MVTRSKPCARCPEIVPVGTTLCPDCQRKADKQRGTSSERGYNSRGHQLFRQAVLAKHPICQICFTRASTDADHYPMSRKELLAAGLDPNDPSRGRGLCHACHSSSTAREQPGGWNIR